MRYYRIAITDPDGNPFYFKSLNNTELTSLIPTGPQNPQNGIANPAALQIELEIAVLNLADPVNKGA